MSMNSSLTSSDSFLHSNASSNNSDLVVKLTCFISGPASFIFTSYIITSIFLLLPLCIFILYHGLQQWQKKPSTSSAAVMSHSDVFTYHTVTMDLIGIFGGISLCSGIYSKHLIMLMVGLVLFSFKWYGETLFHVLTCVEHYLAVVHPITYLSLRKERGIKIRNITTGCVWLFNFSTIGAQMLEKLINTIELCLVILSFIIVFFCSLSVLCVLIRPGPVEQGRGRARVDQSKQRAFYTIVVILGVLMVRFCWGLVQSVVSVSKDDYDCVMRISLIWINLPSSLVLPLLFLHRAGKLACWKKNIQKALGRD